MDVTERVEGGAELRTLGKCTAESGACTYLIAQMIRPG